MNKSADDFYDNGARAQVVWQPTDDFNLRVIADYGQQHGFNVVSPFTGVVTIYDRPFSVSDHEAISANIPVFGVVRNQGVVAAHEEDLSGERAVRTRR